MKLTDLHEARYQQTNSKTLDGWFVAGNNNAQITIALDQCAPQKVRGGYGDMICRIADFSSKDVLVYHYKDALEAGTKVIFGEGETQSGERRWYVMPTSESEIVGWFIRGPELFGDD